jgi:hypothetical protein
MPNRQVMKSRCSRLSTGAVGAFVDEASSAPHGETAQINSQAMGTMKFVLTTHSN